MDKIKRIGMKRTGFLALFFVFVWVCFPNASFSKDNKGFFAGPLSAVPKTPQEKAELKRVKEMVPEKEKAPKVSVEVKEKETERFGFLSWLKKAVGYESGKKTNEEKTNE